MVLSSTVGFDQAMERWDSLRQQLAAANVANAHADIVQVRDEVILFSIANPSVCVLERMFHKRAAKALAALGRLPDAVILIEQAIIGCKRYRATAKLSKPDDLLRDIDTMERLRNRWNLPFARRAAKAVVHGPKETIRR